MSKFIIEKEIFHPENGEIVNPKYHLINWNGTELNAYDDIATAAREAERQCDISAIIMRYKESGPNSFKSVIPMEDAVTPKLFSITDYRNGLVDKAWNLCKRYLKQFDVYMGPENSLEDYEEHFRNNMK